MRVLVACEYSGRVRTFEGIAQAMAEQWTPATISVQEVLT